MTRSTYWATAAPPPSDRKKTGWHCVGVFDELSAVIAFFSLTIQLEHTGRGMDFILFIYLFFHFCYYYLFLQHNNAAGITGQIQVKESEVRHSISQFPDLLTAHENKESLLWGAEAWSSEKICPGALWRQEYPTHSVALFCQHHCLSKGQFNHFNSKLIEI